MLPQMRSWNSVTILNKVVRICLTAKMTEDKTLQLDLGDENNVDWVRLFRQRKSQVGGRRVGSLTCSRNSSKASVPGVRRIGRDIQEGTGIQVVQGRGWQTFSKKSGKHFSFCGPCKVSSPYFSLLFKKGLFNNVKLILSLSSLRTLGWILSSPLPVHSCSINPWYQTLYALQRGTSHSTCVCLLLMFPAQAGVQHCCSPSYSGQKPVSHP